MSGFTSVAIAAWLVRSAMSAESSLDNVKTWIDIAGTVVTGLAIIVGGIWAYFKFAKGRTFRPRFEVDMSGQWQKVDGKQLLQARIRVKNIGASKVTLLQKGTGLRVSVLAKDQPSPPARVKWDSQGVYGVLVEHKWIEPGETVSDDLMLDLGMSEPVPVFFEGRLIWQRFGSNIEFSAHEVIPADATLSGPKE